MNPSPAKASASTPERRLPSDYPRRVLVCVTGMTPQIITETLYKLLQQQPAFVPTEVQVHTTRPGQQQAELTLLEPDTDWFGRLLNDFGIARRQIRFDASCIHAIQTADGHVLEDIRTSAENTAAADHLTRAIAELAQDDDAAIHASLAGGRKTLGYYLGYAMSLFGRQQDRLSHVLVNEPFEGLPDFFFKGKTGQVLRTRDGTPVHTRNAEIDLAEIPFVRLAGRVKKSLQQRLADPAFGFQRCVREAQLATEEPRLRLALGDNIAYIGQSQEPQKFGPTTFLFYVLLARACKAGRKLRRQGFPYEELLQLAVHYDSRDLEDRTANSFDASFFDQRKNAVNETLEKFGLLPDSRYHVQGSDKAGGFSLGLDPDQIELFEPDF
ncbi:MAG TPA: CRISPR-associated ring nuclease Csm6 [Nevskiaceae bacterium]|nr:CRISPR-associated ring nuclease Csm6 [Nevskiaceae bacterium]